MASRHHIDIHSMFEREAMRDAERLREMREGTIHVAPSHVGGRSERPLREAYANGRLGKKAQKAYAGTIRRAPDDATVGSRVSPGSRVRVISATPREFDRIAENGIAVPS